MRIRTFDIVVGLTGGAVGVLGGTFAVATAGTVGGAVLGVFVATVGTASFVDSSNNILNNGSCS